MRPYWLLLFVLTFFSCGPQKKNNDINGQVILVSGSATVNDVPAQVGAIVRYGDVVKTAEDSILQITLEQKNVLQLSANSEFKYMVAAGDGLFELNKGILSAVLKNRQKVKEFRFETPTVTAGVRGTTLLLNVESEKRTYTCLCHGKLRLLPADKSDKALIEAYHHNANYYEQLGSRIQISKSEMKYHDDSQQEALAQAIGETINWSKAN